MKEKISKEEETLLLIKERILQHWETLDYKTRKELLSDLYAKIGSTRGVQKFLDNYLSKTHIQRYVWQLSSKKRKKKPVDTLKLNIPLPNEVSKNIPYTGIDLDKFLKQIEREIIIRLRKMVELELLGA